MLRTALVLALATTLACGAFTLIDRRGTPVAAKPSNQTAVPSPVAGNVLLAGLEAGACVSLPAKRAGSGQTVFIDPGHGGME